MNMENDFLSHSAYVHLVFAILLISINVQPGSSRYYVDNSRPAGVIIK